MKMKKLLAAAGALCLAVTLGACQLFNPTEGRLNDTMHTMFFDFTVTGAYLAKEYEGYQPAEGNQLLVADITVKNTFRESIEMYDTDFQAQWGEDEDPEAYSTPSPRTRRPLPNWNRWEEINCRAPIPWQWMRSALASWSMRFPRAMWTFPSPIWNSTTTGARRRTPATPTSSSLQRRTPRKALPNTELRIPSRGCRFQAASFLRRLPGHLFLDKGTGV